MPTPTKRLKILFVRPYTDSLLQAVFSNGRMVFFGIEDLSWDFWLQLERMETELEKINLNADAN